MRILSALRLQMELKLRTDAGIVASMSAKPKPVAPARSRRPIGSASSRWCSARARWTRSRRRELVPGKKIFYQFSARGHDMAQVLLGLHLTHPKDAICGYYRSRPILLVARRAARRCARLGDGPRRRLFGRARHRRRVQLSQSARRLGAADVRRRRRAIHADRRLGAGDRVSPRACSSDRAYDGAIARRARRRCVGGDQRLLVGADHRDDAEAADAVLHRGQRLRHLRAVDGCRRRAATSPRISRASRACTCSTATAPIPAEAARPDRRSGRRMCAAARARRCCA